MNQYFKEAKTTSKSEAKSDTSKLTLLAWAEYLDKRTSAVVTPETVLGFLQEKESTKMAQDGSGKYTARTWNKYLGSCVKTYNRLKYHGCQRIDLKQLGYSRTVPTRREIIVVPRSVQEEFAKNLFIYLHIHIAIRVVFE